MLLKNINKLPKLPKLNNIVTLRLILVAPFVLQIFAAVGLIGYFSFRNGQKAVNNLANQVIEKATQQVDEYLDSYFALPIQITEINVDAIANNELNLNDPISSGHYFWRRTILILQHRLKAQAKNPGINIIRDYGNLPIVQCYAGQLNQVFMNILANAIDALEELLVKNPSDYQPTITIRTSVINLHWVEIAIPLHRLPRASPTKVLVFLRKFNNGFSILFLQQKLSARVRVWVCRLAIKLLPKNMAGD